MFDSGSPAAIALLAAKAGAAATAAVAENRTLGAAVPDEKAATAAGFLLSEPSGDSLPASSIS
jgi:hypothetical protein